MVHTYKPVIKTEKAVNASVDESYTDKLSSATGSNGLISVEIDRDVIIQRISSDLYASPESGVRELLANEIRACHQARDSHGASPHIEVEFDGRNMAMRGINSLGISQDRFLEVMRVLGVSDNHDSGKSGQFGMGFASYTTLSDIVFVRTYSREDGTKYAVMGKGGLGFQIIDKPEMDSYGTEISLTVRSKVNMYSLKNMVRKCAKLSEIPITMISDEGTEALCGESFAELFSGRSVVHSEDMDIAIADTTWYNRTQSYLAGMPIELTINGIAGINIRNERKFRPTPDRERFSDAVEDKIRQGVVEAFIDTVKSNSPAAGPSGRPDWSASGAALAPIYWLCNAEGCDGNAALETSRKNIAGMYERIGRCLATPAYNAITGRTGSSVMELLGQYGHDRLCITKSVRNADIDLIRGRGIGVFRVPKERHNEISQIFKDLYRYMADNNIEPAKARRKDEAKFVLDDGISDKPTLTAEEIKAEGYVVVRTEGGIHVKNFVHNTSELLDDKIYVWNGKTAHKWNIDMREYCRLLELHAKIPTTKGIKPVGYMRGKRLVESSGTRMDSMADDDVVLLTDHMRYHAKQALNFDVETFRVRDLKKSVRDGLERHGVSPNIIVQDCMYEFTTLRNPDLKYIAAKVITSNNYDDIMQAVKEVDDVLQSRIARQEATQ